MPKASPIQNSFNAGELSPQLKGRIDLTKYRNGCDTMLNFVPLIHGPARKRAGTRFVNEVKDSSKNVRLIPFQYSTEQAYVLEFGDNYIRFYANGGVVLSGGSPYEIASPYGHTELDAIDFAQSADVVYISHPNYPPYKLARYAPTNWTITEVAFDWPPFGDENVESTTITASAITGSITLTASASLFASTGVGGYIMFSEVIESKYNIWKAGDSVSSGDYRHYDGNLYKATSTGTTGTRPPVHNEGTESDGTVTWEFQHDGNGYAEITAYTSPTVVDATVISLLPSTSTSGSTKWSQGAWSDTNGYPRSVTFYEDRLWFAGNSSNPQTLWASVSGDYENHKYGTNDDDGLNYTINTQDMNTIEWLHPGKVLVIGTMSGEFTLSASDTTQAVTPTNVRIISQTTYGNAGNVRPIRIGNVILFVQRAGRKVREHVYQFESDSFVAPDMTILSNHITKPGIVTMSYQQEPSQVVWVVLADGTLAGMTYERAEEVIGWHRHDVGGDIKSIVTIPHWDGDQDSTWMVVERTIDGNTVKYLEYFEKYLTDNTGLFLDCALTYNGSATASISGLDHLEGETVSLLVDGAVHPDLVVSSGAITLQYAGSIVNVGLSYTSTIKTMPVEAGAADGIAQGKTQRINNVTIRLHETGPGLWYGPSETEMDEYHVRSSLDDMDSALPLFTGHTKTLPWPSGYEVAPEITIQHRLPTPCTLVALMPQLTTYDR